MMLVLASKYLHPSVKSITLRTYYICAFKMKRFIPFLLFVLTLASGCVDDELCVGDGTNIIKVKIYDYQAPSTAFPVTFDGIEASGDPENFPSYADSTLAAINLTIDPNSDQTTFIFRTATRSDTLHTQYSVVPRLISPACGLEFLFSNLVINDHSFDSLVVVESRIENEIETNIRLYY